MIRIILLVVLIAAVVAGVAWLAGQGGSVAFTWNGWHLVISMPVFLLGLAVVVIVAMSIVAIVRKLLSNFAP